MSDMIVVSKTDGWVCDRCGHTSANEHDPCSCDGDTDDLLEELGHLRYKVDQLRSSLGVAISMLKQHDPLSIPGGWKIADAWNAQLAQLEKLVQG